MKHCICCFVKRNDLLPPEVVHLILCNLRGVDFVRFQSVSRRTYSITCDLDERSKPTLWQKFVFREFPQPCVESVAPWVYNCDVNDLLLWKKLYINLYTTYLLTKEERIPIVDSHTLHEGGIKLVNDVKFIYNNLFVISTPQLINLIGLADKKRFRSHYRKIKSDSDVSLEDDFILSSVTLVKRGSDNSEVKLQSIEDALTNNNELTLEVCMTPHDFSQGACMSVWTDTCIVYRRLYPFGENEINIYHYNGNQIQPYRKIMLEVPVEGISTLVYNQKRVVLICSDDTICLFPNVSSYSVPVFKYELPQQALKIKMLGDFIVILFEDGNIKTCEVIANEQGWMSFTSWIDLDISNKEAKNGVDFQSIIFKVTDFVLQGHLFACNTSYGLIFVSYLESLNHDTLLRNLKPLHEISMQQSGFLSRMTVDQNNGVKFAVIERYSDGNRWISKVHVFKLGSL